MHSLRIASAAFRGKISGCEHLASPAAQMLLRDSSPVSSDSVFRPHIPNCFTRPTPEIGQENWTAFVKYLWSNFGLINQPTTSSRNPVAFIKHACGQYFIISAYFELVFRGDFRIWY